MDGSMPVSRRKARSWRITAAVGVLGVATLVVLGSLATGDLVVVGSAGLFALAGGWVALRLSWSAVVQSRYEHAVDRTHLARAYRGLFAERSVEHQRYAAEMSSRLSQRDHAIHDLAGSLVGVEMRAVEAERTVTRFRRRLGDAENQIATMGDLITRNLEQQEAARQEQARAAAKAAAEKAAAKAAEHARESTHVRRPPLLGPEDESLRATVVPEWADMEADPVTALVAWEEHAGHVAGRHAAPERPARQA